MNATRGFKRKYLGYIAIALLLVFVSSIVLLAVDYWEKRRGVYSGDGNEGLISTLEYDGKNYVLKDDVETFLVIGLDKYDGNVSNDAYTNDQQADFLLLFAIDNSNSTVTAIQINRDTMAQINVLGVAGEKISTVEKQIALSHTYGNGREVSCRNTADAVSALLLDAKINHYLSLTLDAVPVCNDLVDGVEVTVLDDFTGIDDALVKDQKVTLTGEQALTYVRARNGMEDSTNEHRMIRQRQYIDALYQKTVQCARDNKNFIVESSASLTDYLVSDRSVNQLQVLFEKITSYEFKGILTIDGESVVGEEFMEFHPDEDALKKVVVDVFYDPEQ